MLYCILYQRQYDYVAKCGIFNLKFRIRILMQFNSEVPVPDPTDPDERQKKKLGN